MKELNLTNVANDIYEHLTDFEHDGMNAIYGIDGRSVQNVVLIDDNSIIIELKTGENIVLSITKK